MTKKLIYIICTVTGAGVIAKGICKAFKNYKNKIYKTAEQRQMINEFLSTPEPRKPTPNEKLFASKWMENERTIADCELFYLSEGYKRLTLGQGLKGNEVIERIKKDVSTKRHYKKALV